LKKNEKNLFVLICRVADCKSAVNGCGILNPAQRTFLPRQNQKS
jgi:hypothetical protein